jgi:hypothetical protein
MKELLLSSPFLEKDSGGSGGGGPSADDKCMSNEAYMALFRRDPDRAAMLVGVDSRLVSRRRVNRRTGKRFKRRR